MRSTWTPGGRLSAEEAACAKVLGSVGAGGRKWPEVEPKAKSVCVCVCLVGRHKDFDS